jgi:transglutaminase-like putative cysteine protease
MKRILLLFCLFALAASAQAAGRAGTVTMEFDLTGQAPEETRLWLPYPVSDRDQLISDVRLSGDYAEAAVYTDRLFGNPVLFARWEKGAASRKLSFSFAIERQEVALRDLKDGKVPWDPADYALFLGATSLGPVDGEVKQLAERIVQGKKGVLEKARAIYDWTCENMYRDPQTRGCGKGDVCALLQKPGGKCTDISSVFVALARAAGVPAREVFGLRLGQKAVEELAGSHHCWAEFYLPGTGWVPVDPADVRKAMLTGNLALESDRAKELRAFFWGGLDPFRVRLATGRDLVLNPPQTAGPLNYLMYPYAEVGGRPLDWLEPATFRYAIRWREK